MSSNSKLDYLKKYVKKKKKKVKVSPGRKGGNLAIVDDDVDWRCLVPEEKPECSEEEDDPEDRPVVAEVRDETVVKWQPFGSSTASQKSPDISPDLSPPRQTAIRHDSPDNSPPRRGRRDSTNDLSPPRKGRKLKHRGSHRSSVGEGRQKNNSDNISPPRRARHDSPDISPPRKNRHDPPDISPPRRARHDSPDISPRRIKRHDSPDISPPRRARHSSPDISPPRIRRHDSPDISPPRRARHNQRQPDRDLSPLRKKSRSTAKEDTSNRSPSHRIHSGHPSHRPPSPTQMSSGKKVGLQSAEVLREENAAARVREQELFQRMDPSESGRGAETVYRDKSGRKINPKLERLKQKQEEEKKLEEQQKFMEWGKGTATLRMAEDKVQDELYEMSKPLARYADDEDLERMLKAREREGDPMLKFIKKKPKLTPSGKPKKERPTYKGSFPANRFGIRPGYRWDGVARSNGFEKTWFARETNKKATADMAYKWSVENM